MAAGTLPSPVTPFIGREATVAWLLRRLADDRLLILEKTRYGYAVKATGGGRSLRESSPMTAPSSPSARRRRLGAAGATSNEHMLPTPWGSTSMRPRASSAAVQGAGVEEQVSGALATQAMFQVAGC